MKLNTTYQYLLLLHSAAFIICENYYSIVAPGVIKSNRKYTVAVTLHESSTPCLIRVSILGRLFNASDEVQLQPLETKKIDFFPPKLDNKDYQLLAEGQNGCEFKNQSKLFSAGDAGPKIYIQTDKAVYKPLDLVKFRVVILDEHTRPINIQEPIRVEIFDNDKNRIKQFKDITLIKGVYTGEFKLSQQPVLGKWEIRVVLSGKYSHQNYKIIKVQMYTLPKFSVYVDTPEDFVFGDTKVRAEIYGKYTFDRYVEGVLTVELRKYSNEEIIEQQTQDIDGLAVVEFQLKNPETISKENLIYLTVMLEEKHTGIKQKFSRYLSVRKERYRISIPEEYVEFRNNRPFRLRATVTNWNKEPVWDSDTPAILEHGSKTYKTYLNDEGTAIFEFEPQDDASYTVTFKNSTGTLPNFKIYKESHEVVYCKLILKERPRLGKPVEVEVRSSFNLPYLIYTVVGHATIVQLQHIKLPANKKSYTIKITPSIEMIPVSFLYVYYILDGNFRYEELTLNFPDELENQITVNAPKRAKPGDVVTLKVKAEPKSYISILAVDLGVYLLLNSYDLYKHTILEDLNFDRSYVQDRYIVRPGIISGLVTLTNARYPVYDQFVTKVSAPRQERLNFRKKFPETWIFENFDINNTDTEIVLKIPDTVTTWRITAFSNHAIKGFGIVDGPTDITTFLPFFISLNLPHTIKRDEIIAIPVTIFNYHNQSVDAEVTILNQHMQFEFVESASEYSGGDQQTKMAEIPANGGKTIKFLIKPLKLGEMELRIMANSSLYADGVVQKLKVLPEGITKYQNHARFLSGMQEDTSLSLDIPLDSVNASEFITLSVGGDFMIPALENLDDMINMPTACGEQNMANFASNVLILDYLRATGRSSKEVSLSNEARYYIDIGFQQELSYRHENGGYSVFGQSYSGEISNWLTAYVTRFFIRATKYTPIENRIIDSDLDYLAQQQWFDGSFPFTGYLFYKDIKNKYGFTAFVLLTFMEDRKYARKYQTTIRKGLEYISSDLDDIDDVYALSIIAAALSKARHASVHKVIEKLQIYRKEDKNGLMWWSHSDSDVEITAYVLLALLNLPGNHLPVLKWLIEQRNSLGGFHSTHDTVVGLEALVKFSQKYNNATNWNIKITYSAQDHEGNEVKVDDFLINENNALMLQQHELPRSARSVNFDMKGSGYSLVQLSYQYNVKKDVEFKYFVMKINPIVYNDEQLDLEVCFTYHALEGISNSTNMVIMEANMPSGFQIEAEFQRDLLANDFIQRVERRNDETTMILYFDKLSTDISHCVTLEIFRANEVEDRKPAAIVIYDYYNKNRVNTQFYTI